MRCNAICLLVMLLAFGTVTYASAQDKSVGGEGSGVYVRLVTIEVDPADAPDWEAAADRQDVMCLS